MTIDSIRIRVFRKPKDIHVHVHVVWLKAYIDRKLPWLNNKSQLIILMKYSHA